MNEQCGEAGLRLYYHDDLVAAAHEFDTTRKPRWIVEALEALPVEGVRLVDAVAASEGRLRRVHDADYVEAVRSGRPRDLAESQGFMWDENLFVAAATSAGAAAQAARAALEDGVAGALSTGLHHAAAGHGAGFCTFNGLALATVEALDSGVGSVLILDLDAHCGGGTHAIVGRHGRRDACGRLGLRRLTTTTPRPATRLTSSPTARST